MSIRREHPLAHPTAGLTAVRPILPPQRCKQTSMGIRSKVAKLPASVRAELDRRIVEGAFSGYQALAEWLQAQGYQIADDSVQRYGARLRRQLDAINLAHPAFADHHDLNSYVRK